jgi:hypothetical protein
MGSSGLWSLVDLVRIDISEESVASSFKVKIISGLGATFTTLLNIGSNKMHTDSHPRRRHSPFCLFIDVTVSSNS